MNLFVTGVLADVHQQLKPFYSDIGRPSGDPELMIRMLIVGYAFAIRSERRLCPEVQVNLAYRWFCKLGIEDKIPDHSVFSHALPFIVFSFLVASFLSADSHGCLYLGRSAPLASPITLHRAVFAWPWIVPMLKSRNVRSAFAGTTSYTVRRASPRAVTPGVYIVHSMSRSLTS